MEGPKHRVRPVKTYGRKASRMRKAEKEVLGLYLDRVRVSDDEIISPLTTFHREGPIFVDIGFGRGEFLYEMALRHPEANLVGIEVFVTGVAKLLRRMCGYNNSNPPGPENIKVLLKEAHSALKENFSDLSISRVFILFPDPWPKKRHHKRRLIRPEFTEVLKKKLTPGGSVLVATDHRDYMEAIRDAFSKTGFSEEVSSEPLVLQTKYAQKAIAEGREIYQFLFRM